MSTDQFNFQRFCLVFKRDVVENWGSNLRTYIGMFLGYFIMLLVLNAKNVVFSYNGAPSDGLVEVLTIPITVVTGIYILVGLSKMFSNLSHKQSRISFFMLPASNLEKYLVRLLRHSLMYWLVIFLCFVLADLSAWGAHHLMGRDTALLITNVGAFWKGISLFYGDLARGATSVTEGGIYPWLMPIGHLMSALAWMGTYILGAAIFRKQPFILTSLTIFGVSVLTGLLGLTMVKNFDVWDGLSGDFITPYHLAKLMFYGFLVINTLWTVFCFWITYRMFKNANVIAQRTIGL